MLSFQTEHGKRKFVVCPFVYGETNGLKRLNGLNGLNGLCPSMELSSYFSSKYQLTTYFTDNLTISGP